MVRVAGFIIRSNEWVILPKTDRANIPAVFAWWNVIGEISTTRTLIFFQDMITSANWKLSEWNSAISQTRTYHFPLAIRPPTKMTEKIAAKNRNVSQIGLSTHNHDHEIKPITFSTTKIKVKATTGSVPERLDFFSIHLSPRNPNYRARINPQQPNFSSSTNPSDW